MNEQQALSHMIAPDQKRPGKARGGVIQIHVTRACDKCCYSCTQGSNLAGKPDFITPEQFEQACLSLKGYWGVVGMFGGNPAMHPKFSTLCQILVKHIPREQRGLWCNNPINLRNAEIMRQVFNPAVSNLNVHLDGTAYTLFKKGWPESRPFGLTEDSRHSPPFVSMKDLRLPLEERWELISRCDINQHWSAMIGVFRGQLRAWFCEIAGAQAILHQHEPDYPDTGLDPAVGYYNATEKSRVWWELPMQNFQGQVRQHCHDCGIPLRGHGQLAQSGHNEAEQTSAAHAAVCESKRRRPLQLVTDRAELGEPLANITRYLANSHV